MALKLLLLLCSLAATTQQTRISLDLSIYCSLQPNFEAKIALWEEDDIKWDENVIAGTWTAYPAEHFAHFEGNHTGDWGTAHYEFYLFMKHRCTPDGSLAIEKQFLENPDRLDRKCHVEDEACHYTRSFRR